MTGIRMLFITLLVFLAVGYRSSASSNEEKWVIDEDLLYAIRLGDLPKVQKAIREGNSVNTVCLKEWTPLIHALNARQVDVAKLLVEAGADVNAHDKDGRSALWYACQTRDPGLVRLLLQKGAKPDPRVPIDENDDMFFVQKRQGAFRRDDGYPPLEAAIRFGPAEVIEELIKAGLDLNHLSFDAMLWAARHGTPETIRCLASKGLDPNGQANSERLPLIVASSRGNVENVKALLELKADPNKTGGQLGDVDFPNLAVSSPMVATPLLVAVADYQADAAEVLIRAGADVSAQDNLAIKIADLFGDQRMYDLLLKAGAAKPAPYALGKPTFFSAVRRNPSQGDAQESEPENKKPGSDLLQQYAESIRQIPVADSEFQIPQGKEIKCAIMAESGLDEYDLVLNAKLSSRAGLAMIERSKLSAILAEHQLLAQTGSSISGNLKAGKLLGADALLYLKKITSNTDTFVESRLVDAHNGLILDSHLDKLDPKAVEAWGSRMAARVVTASPKLLVPPGEAVFVSIPHFQSSGAFGSSRTLARQLDLILRNQLVQFPRIFLLERETLNDLLMEKNLGGDASPFLGSSWLLEGNLEVPPDPASTAVALNLRLRPANKDQALTLSFDGDRKDLIGLVKRCSEKLAASLNQSQKQAWEPGREAQAYAEQAGWCFQNGFFEQAVVASDAASALGLRDAKNDRIGISARGKIIGRSAKHLSSPGGVHFDFMEWEWRAQPEVIEEYVLSPRDYLDTALAIVGDQERFVSAYANLEPGARWDQLGYALRQASIPLTLISSLSARSEYAQDLKSLRGDLVALNDRLIALGKEKGDYDLVNRMLAIRCMLASWWFDSPGDMKKEILRIYRDEAQRDSRISEEIVADTIYSAAAKGYPLDLVPGPAPFRMAWKELAGELAKSDHPGERFLGTAIRARGKFSLSRSEDDFREAIKLFPAVYASGAGEPPPGRIVFVGDNYSSILGEMISQASREGMGGIFEDFRYDARSGSGELLDSAGYAKMVPELAQYLADLALLRLGKIQQVATGGISDRLWSGSFGSSGGVEYLPLCSLPQLSEALRKSKDVVASVSNPTQRQVSLLKDLNYWIKALDERLGVAGGRQNAPCFKIGNFRIPLIEGEFLSPKPDADCRPNNSNFASNPIWYGGKLWAQFYYMGSGESSERERYIMEYDLKTKAITMHPGPETTAYPLAITDDYIVNMANYEDKVVAEIFDRKKQKWESRKLLEKAEVRGFSTVGENLFVVFNEVSGRESKDNPVGIIVCDLKTNHTELLVSTSRKPAQSPLDHPGLIQRLRHVKKDSKGRAYFGPGVEGQQVAYDLSSKAWVPLERGETDQFTPRGYPENCKVDESACSFNYKSWDRGALRLLKTGKEIDIPAEYDFSVDEQVLKKFPAANDQYQFLKKNPDFWVYTLPVGIFLRHNSGFFFVPVEDMKETIRAAFQPAEKKN